MHFCQVLENAEKMLKMCSSLRGGKARRPTNHLASARLPDGITGGATAGTRHKRKPPRRCHKSNYYHAGDCRSGPERIHYQAMQDAEAGGRGGTNKQKGWVGRHGRGRNKGERGKAAVEETPEGRTDEGRAGID